MYCAVLIGSGNVHALDGAPVVRSGQLDGAALQAVLRAHGVRAVINLRGAHPGTGWYDTELAVSRAAGAAHADLALSARAIPTQATMERLVDLLRAAPKPVLIHCRAGADRSGLAAALYRYAIGHASAEAAARELSVRYAHFPYLFNRTGAMDAAFTAYVQAHPG